MAGLSPNAVALMVYRLASMLVGLALVYMGYRLFLAGWFERAGDLKAAWGEHHLELKQAAPGTVYAVLGAVVIPVSLAKGFSVESGSTAPGPTIKVMGADTSARPRGLAYEGPLYGGVPLYYSSDTTDYLGIARRAVAGDSISPAERRAFLEWYSYLFGRRDSMRFRSAPRGTPRRK